MHSVLGSALAGWVFLAAPAATPDAAVKQMDQDAHAALGGGDPTPKLEAFADRSFDFEELAKRSLGPEWDKANASQRKRLTQALRGIIEATYLPQIKAHPDFTLKTDAVETKGEEATAKGSGSTPGVEPVPLVLHLHQKGGRWMIFDAEIDQVDLVDTYTDQFSRQLAKKGLDGLISTLENKRAQLEKAKS